ncbi:hypothetical protein [Nostoc sp. CENA543]|uniref:hypothetical protein n=1 Tax=Nostoc sp. CENA543 TaxID=1869241 RepID=UPI0012FFEF9A|nr:hypothetical protein [Nostoc sp. CENA543]
MAKNPFKINKEQATLHHQLSIFDLQTSQDNITTGKVCQILNICPEKLQKKCNIGKFWEIDNYIVLHKGHNSWRILKTQ